MSYALKLAGQPSYLSAPSNSAYNFGTGDFTLQCWVKTTASGTVISRKSTEGGSNYGGFLLVIKAGGVVKFATDNGFGFYEINTNAATNVCDGSWHFMTAVRQSSQLSFYLDGNPVASTVRNNINPPLNVNNSMPLYIGAVAQQQEQYNQFAGQLDEVRIWNRALSQSEIQATMNESLTGTEPGLIGYYTFAAENGNDSSPTHNNASPVGTVSYVTPGVFPTTTSIQVPPNTMITMSGTTYSSSYERTTVTIEGFDPIVFTGSGENVPMTCNGQNLIALNTGNAVAVVLNFEYSTNGSSGPFLVPTVLSPVIAESNGYVTATVKTENGDDSDNNDSIFVINWSV